MEIVYVFVWVDMFQQQGGVQVGGQGQLDQDVVDGGIVVQVVDQGQQVVLVGFGGKIVGLGEKVDFFVVFVFVCYIDLRGWIGVDQDYCQVGNVQVLLVVFGYVLGYLLVKVGGDCFVVDQLCGYVGRVIIELGGKRMCIFVWMLFGVKEVICGFVVIFLYS